MIRRAVLAGAIVLGLIGVPAGAWGQDNVSVADNTKDGTNVFDFSFSIRLVMGDVVDQSNAAVAYASCTDCQTVAIAIQVLLVTGDPEIVSSTNLALAINENCSLCETMASAIQIVLGTGGMVRFTGEGRLRLAELRRRLLELQRSDLSLAQIDAALKEIVAELRDVLATELVPAGPAEGTSSPSPAPTPTSLGGDESPSATPSASDGSTAPTPTQTPTAEPSEAEPTAPSESPS